MNILGLDLGVGSIGWAIIRTDDNYNPIEALGLGSRIISLTPDESNNFTKGSGMTKCAERTAKRTARKMLNRFQDRRRQLFNKLSELGMISNDFYHGWNPMRIWQLRADAATPDKTLSLPEIGNVLRHMSQKRGYRHSKADAGDSKQTEYVRNVNARWEELQKLNETIGQHNARMLRESETITSAGKKVYTYRIKDKGDRVLPRQAYEAEFDAIMAAQAPQYPDVLTDNTVAELKNIIFYQRPLKSCKHLVSYCDFESRIYVTKDGKEVIRGPKVAPRTSPLSEVTRIWETVNNLVLTNSANKLNTKKRKEQLSLFDNATQPKDIRLLQYEYHLDATERARIAEYLLHNEKLTESKLIELLGLKGAGFKADKNVVKGLKGNATYCALKKALSDYSEADELLRFDIEIEDTDKVDTETGEIIQIVSESYMTQPLYKLWHLIYSISSKEELLKNLQSKYGITDQKTLEALYGIDFVQPGFASRSSKFMRRILPYLIQGYQYSEASTIVGVNHSDSLTKEENMSRILKNHLDNIAKGELRQPIVEKILNQMINIVNTLSDKYGKFDEIRVELARELRQSKEQRANATIALSKREKENQKISEQIKELGLRPSRRNIQKYRLYTETGGTCIYCGQTITLSEFLGGHGAEIEHVIPRSLLFDDSFSNKVCACRNCNQKKGQNTGYDFVASQGEEKLLQYVARVNKLYSDNAISKTKRDRLLCEMDKIPSDFLERDLRETQYISKKAREILRQICYNVHASSGSVTDFLRHVWGYDMIIHNLNINRYEKADLVSTIDIEHKGQIHHEKRIQDWSKRKDHRHHAIDALVIAQTRQGYIQRLSNLNKERDAIYQDINISSNHNHHKFHLLEEWGELRPHLSVSQVAELADQIAVSYKPGKKLTTPGKRYENRGGKRILRQTQLLIPRGSLHQETVYGRIKLPDGEKTIKFAFLNPELIVDPKVRTKVIDRIKDNANDTEKAIHSLKKNPIRDNYGNPISKIECFRNEYVYRVNIQNIEYKNIDKIIDLGVREAVRQRYEQCDKNLKKFQQSIVEDPLTIGQYPTRIINTVRCTTGLTDDKMIATRKDSFLHPIGYSKSGNNHHVAFYATPDEKVETLVTSMWTGVKRKNIGFPVIIDNPEKAWSVLNSLPDCPDIDELANTLPLPDRKFLFSLQMNEMVILGLSEDSLRDAIQAKDKTTLCRHLYRVQKLAINNYVFRHHTHTVADMDAKGKALDYYKLLASFKALKEQNLTKVRVNSIGQIIIGEVVI